MLSGRSRSAPEREPSRSPTATARSSRENTVDAQAGSSSDLVLHLTTAAGDPPVVTQFANDLTGVPSDKASLTVAHTAAVPPADIRVDGQVLFANVANGESLNLVVPAGSYSVDIVPAGESSPVVFGPVNLTVQGGSLNRVYAVGDPSANDDERGRARHHTARERFGTAHNGRHRHGRHRRGGATDRAHPAPVARLSRPIPAAVRRLSTALVILLWLGAACSASPAPAHARGFGQYRPRHPDRLRRSLPSRAVRSRPAVVDADGNRARDLDHSVPDTSGHRRGQRTGPIRAPAHRTAERRQRRWSSRNRP